jgi:hypothetical protein
MVWLGLYPKPVLSRMEPSAKAYVEQVQRGLPAEARPAAPEAPAAQATLPPGAEDLP